jgi:hypothetical protein
LFAAEAVDYQGVMEPHWAWTLEQAAACGGGTVLFIQDTTTLCFDHPASEGLGPTSAKADHGTGMLLHTSLAVDVSGLASGQQPLPLGLAYGQLWARGGDPRSGSRKGAESCKWPDAIRAVGPPPSAPPPSVPPRPAPPRWVHVGDAESDCWEALEAAEASDVAVVLRCGQDRVAIQGHGQGPGRPKTAKLRQLVHAAGPLASKWIYVRRRPGREPGCVRLNVSAVAVTLLAPRNWPAGKPHRAGRPKPPPMRLWVVRVWEPEPVAGEAALEWVLLSNRPITSPAAALEVAGWYACRWLIEEYHKCLKSGCRVEQRQLQDAARLAPLVGVLSVVATRLLRLKTVARSEPDAPAARAVPEKYVRALAACRGLEERKLTSRAFWIEVAKMGGFLARRGDGDPGWLTTWRGWTELELLTAGFELAAKRERCG